MYSVVARWLKHVPYTACVLSVVCGVWVTYIIQKKVGKKGMNYTRLELSPSNPKAGIVTMLPFYHFTKDPYSFFSRRA